MPIRISGEWNSMITTPETHGEVLAWRPSIRRHAGRDRISTIAVDAKPIRRHLRRPTRSPDRRCPRA